MSLFRNIPLFKKIKIRASLVFFIVFLGNSLSLLAGPLKKDFNHCSTLLMETKRSVKVEGKPSVSHREIRTLGDLLLAFTEGLSPNFKDIEQRKAFEIYRNMRFGDPNTTLNEGAVGKVALQISNHPNLERDRTQFRNYELEVSNQSYPVNSELEQFLSSQVKSAGRVRANLFQIEANLGVWKKLLQYQEPERFSQIARDKDERAALKKEAKEHFLEFLNDFLSGEDRVYIGNVKESAKDRAKFLFKRLLKAKENLIVQGSDTRFINQAIVDLIHTVGYFEPAISRALKSDDGLERLGAYRKILEKRDSFAMELGYENHFEQVLQTFSVPMPTGMTSKNGLSDQIQEFETQVIAGATRLENSSQKRTIRHLSLPESPFRSCLGGSDCSSNTYLTRALDPNYHYFTLTDSEGYSSGHITVVLGDAKQGGRSTKVAFIDKIQNVDNVDLPLMIEGVRKSVLEQGYLLALPEDLGDHNGLSNDQMTRSFVERDIGVVEDAPLSEFKPHKHYYRFPNRYSRAEDGLLMNPVRELRLNQDVALNRGIVNIPWKASGFKLEDLVQASIELKNGDLNDRQRYIPSMKAIEAAGLDSDPSFDETISSWLMDPHQDFILRKQVLIFKWTERKEPLSDLLAYFNSEDQVNLIQNLLDTPRYKELVVSDEKKIPSLLVLVRSKKKVREILIQAYDSKLSKLLTKVLESQEFSNNRAQSVIVEIKESLGSVDLDAMVNVLSLVAGSAIETGFERVLFRFYVSTINSDADLGRGLSVSLNSIHPDYQHFGRRILEWSEELNDSHYPILRVYREIVSFHESGRGGKTLEESGQLWMGKAGVRAELKADFLMAQVGQGNRAFDRLLERVPASQREALWKRVDERSSLKTFLDIADRMGVRDFLLDEAVLESFLYESRFFPKEGSPKTYMMGEGGSRVEMTLESPFEMAATQTTQLQYALVMGESPSYFIVDKKSLVLQGKGEGFKWNSKKVEVDPNRPVEQVSWEDAQKYIERLSELNPHFKFDLPTDVQWEFAARGGTETTYSFGEDVEELGDYAWYSENSGRQTQPVARLRANPFCLFDIHGNVWEWVHDWRADLPQEPRKDYKGPQSGSHRVFRGGSWRVKARGARSASRGSKGPNARCTYVGFRTVRTLK